MILRLTLFSLIAVLAGCGGASDKTANGGSTDSAPAYGALTLAQSTYTVSQTVGSVAIIVNRVDGSGGAVSIDFATTDGTAVGGADYTAASGTLDWADGDASAKTITVAVTDVTAFSGARTFALALSNPSGGATLGATTTSTVTINGAGAAGTVGLSAASYSVAQSAKTLTISVERASGSSGAIGVSYATADGTALAGTDYTAANGTLAWTDGDTTAKTFTVTVDAATAFQGSKTFTVTLSSPTGATLATPSKATVTISGSSVSAAGAVALSAASFAVAQNAGSLTVTVARTGGSSGAASVGYSSADGSAKTGTDYTAASGTLSWAAGDSASKTFTLSISNAHPFSGAKTLTLALTGANGASLGAPSSATVTINGDAAAAGTLAFSAATYAIAQNGTALTVSVTRSTGSAGAASVSFATADNTAKAGTDYTAASGTLKWADGDGAAKTFSVAVSNSSPFSGSRNFAIALASASGAALGSPVSAVATINGDAVAAGTLELSAATYTALQSAGSLVVTVNRTNGSGGAVSVGYGTADTSAKAGSDYTATSGILKWAAGDASSKTFAIPLGATPISGSKTFAIAIASPGGGATLGTPSNAVASISGSSTSAPAGAMGQTAAARLLSQGTFGATIDSVSAAASQTYDAWFSAQFAAAPSLTYASVPNDQTNWTEFWLTNAVKGQDQLRQRMAFALSQIFVVSNSSGALTDQNKSMAFYYDMLATNAFGNFRSLLQTVTLNPEMGTYLSMLRNAAANPALGTHADENYAREIMQLFTIGLVQLNIDGSVQTDSSGNPLPTYTQADVQNLARVFTGWASNPNAHAYGDQSWLYDIDYFNPMVAYPTYHDSGAKTLLNNTAIAAGGTPASDMKTALDTLFNHPNVGPFLGKQLIERLVSSNPSPAYVARVATVFNNNGQGVRGDLGAVVKAVLTDPEAVAATGYGKLREPLLRTVHLWRAFSAVDSTGMINEYQVVQNSMATYDESPLQSASVFNFYRPDYQYAGPLTTDGLVVPEFQILNENTLVLADMQNISEAYDFIDSQGTQHSGYQGYSGSLSSSSVMLHTAGWEPLAATPANLVNELNLIFMAGQMPTAMQTTLTNYIAGIPANAPWSRVAEAAELVIDSPQYSVQR